jgi:hypothetical protein
MLLSSFHELFMKAFVMMKLLIVRSKAIETLNHQKLLNENDEQKQQKKAQKALLSFS